MDERDYKRFIHDLYEFNDVNPALNMWYLFKNSDVGRHYQKERVGREPLVDVLAFALMPNHYHLMVQVRNDDIGAISLFMKKMNGGYARYFNEKHQRKGTLFQSRYKAVAVTSEAHFIHLPYYIHLNPLDLRYKEWRERTLRSPQKAWEYLLGYRWSSHLDYLGKHNYPSVTNRTFLLDCFGDEKEYAERFKTWLAELEPTKTLGENMKGVLLE